MHERDSLRTACRDRRFDVLHEVPQRGPGRLERSRVRIARNIAADLLHAVRHRSLSAAEGRFQSAATLRRELHIAFQC